MSVATPETEIDLSVGSNMTIPYKKAYEKLEKLRKQEIPYLQKNLSIKRYSAKEFGRRKAQLTLLHRKRQNIMQTMKRQALMLYLYAGYRTGAKYFAWDGVQGISPRYKKGKLATAITYMPNRIDLYDNFISWASDLKIQGDLSNYRSTEVVSSFTSQVCGDCFAVSGKMNKTLLKVDLYDKMICKNCGKIVNRHSNAARVSALLLKKKHQAVA